MPAESQRRDGPSPSEFRSYWDRKHRSSSYRHAPLQEFLLDLLQSTFADCAGFVLDHGCGQGRVAEALAQRGKAVALNDISAIALAKARNRLVRRGLAARLAHGFCGQIKDWRGPTPWFGFVSHRVLHTIPLPHRLAAVTALSSSLAMGGKGIVTARSIRCSRYEHMLSDPAFELVESSETTFARPAPFRYLHFFKEGELESTLAASGLSVLQTLDYSELTGNTERGLDTQVNRYWLIVCQKGNG